MTLPYDFVPFQPVQKGVRLAPTPLNSINPDLHTGSFRCQLLAFSPLFIGGTEEVNRYKMFFHYPGSPPVIPAATLKGCIRSVAEALSNGCVSVFAGKYKNLHEEVVLPDDVRPCDDVHRLCPTCRLFGMCAPESESKSKVENKEKLSYRGKVSFTDASLINRPQTINLRLDQLYSPRPHEDVYFVKKRINGRNKQIAIGRKFYYHRDSLETLTNNNGKIAIAALAPGARFEFEVSFSNLSNSEIALLVLALELHSLLPLNSDRTTKFDPRSISSKNGIFHKIGYGKPVGLGTAAIYITQFKKFNPSLRYGHDKSSDADVMGVKEMHEWIKKQKSNYLYPEGKRGELPLNIAKLFEILRLPNGLGDIRYPVFSRR